MKIIPFLRRFILSSVACPALPLLPTLSYKRLDIRDKNITSSVYDCTVEDVEYIYNQFSL